MSLWREQATHVATTESCPDGPAFRLLGVVPRISTCIGPAGQLSSCSYLEKKLLGVFREQACYWGVCDPSVLYESVTWSSLVHTGFLVSMRPSWRPMAQRRLEN